MRFITLPMLRNAAAVIAVTAASYGLHAQALQQADPPGGYGAPGATSPAPSTSAVRLLKRLDTDQDGQVSREEAARMPALAEKFDALDRDRDARLNVVELDAAIAPPK